MSSPKFAWIFAFTAGAAVGCQLVSGASDTKFVPASSGHGGATSSGTHGGGGGQGGGGECTVASDCKGTDLGCQPRACSNGKCGTKDADKNAACMDDGGKYCDGMGKCVQCNEDTQCKAGSEFCSMDTHVCRSLACQNKMKDPGETSVDCGGPNCDPCNNGGNCKVAGDCKSGYCEPQGGVGGMGAGGAGGAGGGGPMTTGVCVGCKSDADCAGKPSTYCKNPGGSGVCTAQQKLGVACGKSNECLSAHCADGVCCDKGCSGECASCLKSKNGAADGTCGAVVKNTDPDGECVAKPMDTCGAKGMGCNGNAQAPACVDWEATTQCVPQICEADGEHVTTARFCDGPGTCKPGVTTDCAGYKCKSGACLTSCASELDCAGGNYCDTNKKCQPKKNLGAACGGSNECVSAACADKVCCNAACNGACDACTVALGAPMDGQCAASAVKSGTKAGACDAMNGTCAKKPCSCDATGTCKEALGVSCATGADCASGFCADGVCCNTACGAACAACSMAAGADVNGTCKANAVTGKNDPGTCNGAGGCTKGGLPNMPCTCSNAGVCKGDSNAPCGGAGDCATNVCLLGKCT